MMTSYIRWLPSEKRAGERAELTRAAQSLPSPLLFRARGLLTISVAVRVTNDSRMRMLRGRLRWRRREKIETRYTRAWPCGESRARLLTIVRQMVTLIKLSGVWLRREKMTD
jgi:hypothetical protein